VATDPAIAALPAVAMDPATAELPAVAIDPATAALPAVAIDPDTATFPADEARRTGRRVFMFRGCQVAGRRTPGRANFGQPLSVGQRPGR